MTALFIKHKVLKEIDLIPEDRLADLYNFIHYFRLGLEKSQLSNAQSVMSFAGSWKDMPEETFAEFIEEITERRRTAFKRRRGDEGITD